MYTVASYKMGYTIGVGTFGRVKLATHEKTGEKVAVKIINRARMKSLEMSTKLLREISILQKLGSHPHIIRLYELIDTPTDIFVVMEFVPGGELFDYIVQRARLSESEARKFFFQIISGVQYCHDRMVCHRDLKPENVLLVNDRTVKIGDFGLSNIMNDGDFLKTSCGSPNYAAPEVVSGKAYVGPEVDVWSCGVILYALVCGTLPFDDEHVPNLFKKIKHGSFTLPGHLSPSVKSLICRLLLVDPAERITLRDVRRHPWLSGLHPAAGTSTLSLEARGWISSSAGETALLDEPPLAAGPRVDQGILAQLRDLGYTIEEEDIVRHQRSVIVPKQVVAYNLLYDKKLRAEAANSPPSRRRKSQSASVFSKELRAKVATANALQFDSNPSGHQMIGEPIYDNVAIQWKLGFDTSLESVTLMTAVYHLLRSLDYEWVSLSSYKVLARLRIKQGGPQSSQVSAEPPPAKQVESSIDDLESQASENKVPSPKTQDSRAHLVIQIFKLSHSLNRLCLQAYSGPSHVVAEQSLIVLYGLYKMAYQVAARIKMPLSSTTAETTAASTTPSSQKRRGTS